MVSMLLYTKSLTDLKREEIRIHYLLACSLSLFLFPVNNREVKGFSFQVLIKALILPNIY